MVTIRAASQVVALENEAQLSFPWLQYKTTTCSQRFTTTAAAAAYTSVSQVPFCVESLKDASRDASGGDAAA